MSVRTTATVTRPSVRPDAPRPHLVKQALVDLESTVALGLNPLALLAVISPFDAASELKVLLVDVIAEVADSFSLRDAESGNLLLDYYIKRVGSHERIMERLHLSRPTYYRRLRRGYVLVAQHLDRVCAFAARFPI